MKITAKVDVTPVNTYYAQLASMLRQSLPRTIRFEAAATVRRAMQMQKSSSVDSVRRAATLKGVAKFTEGGPIGGTTSVGKRSKVFGRQWMVRRDIGRVMPMSLWEERLAPLKDRTGQGWHARDADWMRFKAAWARDIAMTKKSITAKLGARGITAKSYFDILVALNTGAPVAASFIQRARPISGRMRQVGFAQTFGENTSQPMVVVTNTSGVAIATSGQRKLNSAISIRRAAFMKAMEKDLFFDMKFVARNYPWAKVS